MRAYFFGNMYLSSIQQGIQAAHVVAEMFTKYPVDHECIKFDDLNDWAHNHKTMILLNGGHGETLHDLIDFFDQDDNPYPFEFFKESEGALDSALTSVGIVLPEKIYEGAAMLRKSMNDYHTDKFNYVNTIIINCIPVIYTDWEKELMTRINTFGLAR